MDQDVVCSQDTAVSKTADEASLTEIPDSENYVERTTPKTEAIQKAVGDDTPMEDVSGSDRNSSKMSEEDNKKSIGTETTTAGGADSSSDADMALDHPVHDENNVHKHFSKDGKNNNSAEKISTSVTTNTASPPTAV